MPGPSSGKLCDRNGSSRWLLHWRAGCGPSARQVATAQAAHAGRQAAQGRRAAGPVRREQGHRARSPEVARSAGLVTVSTGPSGGATIGEVPLDRAFQLLQNYLFFRDMDVAQIYAVRRLLEPELAAGAVPHLTKEHFEALERSIAHLRAAARERGAGAVAAPGGSALPRRAGRRQSQHAAALHVPGDQPPAAPQRGDEQPARPLPTSSSARPMWPRTSACWRRRDAAMPSACASSWSSISTRPSATSSSSTPRCAGASSSIRNCRRAIAPQSWSSRKEKA